MVFTVLDVMEEEAINSPSLYDYDPEDYVPEQDPDREYVFDE